MLFVLSSPLLIDILNVPESVLTPEISYLKLSSEPVFKDPSENSNPLSVAPVELFKIVPSAKVFNVNATAPVAESVPPSVIAPKIPGLAPDPELKLNPLPPVPAAEPVIPILTFPSFLEVNELNLLTLSNSVTKLLIN